jgi:type IV pilus assembly protein PilB
MVIVSGPTGSGKTTTLYATLNEINRTDINVMTIEDPVEYVFPSVNQIQINTQADVTFASGLKSILRQDPDVILVGEVRDLETARIAVQSALTGHLVLSSIHATDSVAALFRLLDMGVEPFLVASSINSVVAQRLVRRICRACAAPYEPTTAELATYEQLDGPPKHSWVRGTGCNLCSDTGYYDRVGVYEVLNVTDEIRHAVVSGSTIADVRKLAVAQGLRSLRQEAMRLVADDLTTIDEVIKNVYVAEASL